MGILKYVLLFVMGYLAISIYRAMQILKKQQAIIAKEYEEKREKFAHITKEVLDETADEELKQGIIYHIFSKEDEDFEHLKENLTAGELVVYTAYQMEIAVENGRGSVYDFFTGPAKEYVPHLISSFEALGSEKMTELMKKITDLVVALQTGKYDDDENAPTFQDYTFDYLDLVESEKMDEKMVEYIRANSQEFIN